MTRTAAALALALAACVTVQDELSVPGGRVLRADVRTNDGATIALWRWTPTSLGAPKVLVVPELGFDHTLVTPLCERLRGFGWDVATLEGRHVAGVAGGIPQWNRDVARALASFGPAQVVAIGLGGRAALDVAEAEPALVTRIVALNVPLAPADANAVLAEALAATGFAPKRWMGTPEAAILLGSGRHTPQSVLEALARSARPMPPSLADDATRWLEADMTPAKAGVPVHAFAGLKDNLVQPEQALVPMRGATAPATSRRMGRLELFLRDYGHLDWLVDPEALADVAPVIAASLEAP